MIQVFYGENEFLKRQKVRRIIGDKNFVRRDGQNLSVGDLRELLMGQTFFGGDDLVVINDLSENIIWNDFPEITEKSDKTIILLEAKLDKRTKTYKWLAKNSKIVECASLNERNRPEMTNWALERSSELNLKLSRKQIETLIDRLGYDQLRFDNIFEQLVLIDNVTDEVIDDIVPLAKSESVFDLLNATISADRKKTHQIIAYLESTSSDEGAYQTMGLIASQIMHLYALILNNGDTQAVAKDFGAHPFALRQLSPLARKLDRKTAKKAISILGKADIQTKTTSVKPWLILEAALIEISYLIKK